MNESDLGLPWLPLLLRLSRCRGCRVSTKNKSPSELHAQLNSWFVSEVTPVLRFGCEQYTSIRPVVWRATFLLMIIISDTCCFKSRSPDWDTQIGPKPASQRLWKTVEIRKTAKTWSPLQCTRKHLECIYRCSTWTPVVKQ